MAYWLLSVLFLTGCTSPPSIPTSLPSPSVDLTHATPSPSLPVLPIQPSLLIPQPIQSFNYLDDLEWVDIRGYVFDDNHLPLTDVKVNIQSLNLYVPYEQQTITDSQGHYKFTGVAFGVQHEITVSKPGYTRRREVKVFTIHSQPECDFGVGLDPMTGKVLYGPGSDIMAMSDKPEVVAVTPGRNSANAAPHTDIKLAFSEPVDQGGVEAAFAMTVYQEKPLSIQGIDALYGPFETLGAKAWNPTKPFPNIDQLASYTWIWDRRHFETQWNEMGTEVTLRFRNRYTLPTDRETARAPEYMVSFLAQNKPHVLRDLQGNSRPQDWFKLTDGTFESLFKFQVAADRASFRVLDITAHKGILGIIPDRIKVRFNKPLLIYTPLGYVGALNTELNARKEANPLTPTLYRYQVIGNSPSAPTVENIPDGVKLDPEDPTFATLILESRSPFNPLFEPYDRITLKVASTLQDPAGNYLSGAEQRFEAVVAEP